MLNHETSDHLLSLVDNERDPEGPQPQDAHGRRAKQDLYCRSDRFKSAALLARRDGASDPRPGDFRRATHEP
ncbi:hypothetical protein AB5I41_18085 [Sphingomonas sp. MMS24-JH45]